MNRLWWLFIGFWVFGLALGAALLQAQSPRLPKINERILQARPLLPTGTFQVSGTSTPAKPKETTIQFFGDIMLERNVRKAMATSGLDYILKNIVGTKLFGDSEIKIANLEGPFTEKKIKTSKEIAFGFDPIYVSDLKRYGFDAFNLANNHSYDMGKQNLLFTRDLLEKNNIGWFGDELSESESLTWFTTSSDGTRLAFLGVHNTYHKPDKKKLLAAIEDARSKADLVIVNVHWGEEYHATSTRFQQEFGHWFIDNGVDVVIGHHPHVVEEVEIYNGKPIVYSLGNFIFDQYFSKETQEGLSVKLTIEEKKLKNIELLPFKSRKSQVVEMGEYERDKFLEELASQSRLEDKQIIGGEITF
jgi:poly-gamma-glutamate synthesis protein (capsule biosynthesis protein)